MNKNLFNILDTFTAQDWEKLGKFISSPYFVNKRNYKNLYLTLKKIYQKKPAGGCIDVDYLRRKIQKTGEEGKQTLHNRLSEFCKLTERFLAQESFETDTLQKNDRLFSELMKRNLYKNFNTSLNRLESIFKDNEYDTDKLSTLSDVLQMRSMYFQSLGMHEKSYTEFYRHSQYLMAYFLDKLFYISLEFLLLEGLDVKFDNNTAKQIVNSIDTNNFINEIEDKNEPAFVTVVIRYYLYKAFLEPNEKFFIQKIKSVFSKHRDNLNDEFKSALYLKLEAFYVNHINKGRSEYEKELFLLYKEKLGQGIIGDLFKIYYPAQNFRDYVVVGLRVGEIEWAENFIKDYSPMLPESIRKDEQTLAMARVHIAKSELTKALKILKNHRSDKQIHIIDMSRLKLKIYYEEQMYEEIFLEMDNLKHYIRKTNTHKFFREMTKNYLDAMSELMKLTTGVATKSIVDDFIVTIRRPEKLLPEKGWFIEKANQLKS